jgi:hypothetical protein
MNMVEQNKEPRVSREVAESEFDRFVESMSIDVDKSLMDEDEERAFERQKNKLVKAIMDESLVINDEGEAVYTPCNKRSRTDVPLTFNERTGNTLTSTDSKGKNAQAAKMYAMMGDMCRVPPKTFSGLVGQDIKMCEAIFSLLMD